MNGARATSAQPWPLLMAAAIAFLAAVIVAFMHPDAMGGAGLWIARGGWWFLLVGLAPFGLALYLLGRAVVRDAPAAASSRHVLSARTGMMLFFLSEAMFFATIFAAYLYFAFGAALQGSGLWPPAGLMRAPAWPVPALNTAILLASGTGVVVAHHCFLAGRKRGAEFGLVLAILLGLLFLILQAREFINESFTYQDGNYPSLFYVGTGFHGLHVMIGVILLSIALFRLGRFTREAHFGLEAPIWYWHFVDVVWLFLFTIFYIGWN